VVSVPLLALLGLGGYLIHFSSIPYNSVPCLYLSILSRQCLNTGGENYQYYPELTGNAVINGTVTKFL
jgi:hypothetical protein